MNDVIIPTVQPVWLLLLNAALLMATFSCFYWLAISARRQRSLERALRGMQAELHSRFHEFEYQLAAGAAALDAPVEAPAAKVFVELQSSERTKIMKYKRLGKSPEEIAPLVGLPTSTVRLLLKVQAIEAQAANSSRESKSDANNSIQTRVSIDRG